MISHSCQWMSIRDLSHSSHVISRRSQPEVSERCPVYAVFRSKQTGGGVVRHTGRLSGKKVPHRELWKTRGYAGGLHYRHTKQPGYGPVIEWIHCLSMWCYCNDIYHIRCIFVLLCYRCNGLKGLEHTPFKHRPNVCIFITSYWPPPLSTIV